MEMIRHKKTFTGMFLKYLAVLCANTLLLCAVLTLAFQLLLVNQKILPANYAEKMLKKNEIQIQKAEKVTEEMIPQECNYGVYTEEGEWLYGTLPEQDRKSAWTEYKKSNIFKNGQEFYFFITRENGEVFIAEYVVRAHFAGQTGREFLTSPEILFPLFFLLLFLMQTVLWARRFAKQIKKHLREIHVVTEKIAENTLEFEETHSEVKEVEEILQSLNRMKNELQQSLKQQWEMEEQREEQLAALAHDIKTPLTVIRGNVELLAEECENKEEQNQYEMILKNAAEIEAYLQSMQQVLRRENEKKPETVTAEELAQEMERKAVQLAAAVKIKAVVKRESVDGKLLVRQEQVLRAWENLLSNALEYTRSEMGIQVEIGCEKKEGYLIAKIKDYGDGFTAEDMNHATETFYRGDSSRHDRRHQGLGLSIVQKTAEMQGGFFEMKNSEETKGAEVTLGLKCLSENDLTEEMHFALSDEYVRKQ